MMVAMMMVAVLAIAVWYATRESFSAAKPARDPAAKSYSWLPGPKGTYVFADPPSRFKSLDPGLDVALRRAVDNFVPQSVLDGAGDPQPTPYVETQAEDVAREALARVRGGDGGDGKEYDGKEYDLSLVSIEYAAVAYDALENVRYDIAMMAYDQTRNVVTKLVLTALTAPDGRTYVKKLECFNRDSGEGPAGAGATDQVVLAEYANDLGVDYDSLYPI